MFQGAWSSQDMGHESKIGRYTLRAREYEPVGQAWTVRSLTQSEFLEARIDGPQGRLVPLISSRDFGR